MTQQLYMIEGKQRLHTKRTISQAFMMSAKDATLLRLKAVDIDKVLPGVKIYGYVKYNDKTKQYVCGRHYKGAPHMSSTAAPRYYASTRQKDALLTFRALVTI